MKNLIVFIKSSYSTIWPQSVQHDSANKMRINETYPTTNISNDNNYQSVDVTRRSPPFIIKLNTFLTNKEASKFQKPLFCCKAFRKRRCLYFYSPYGLVKIRHNSQKCSPIPHSKTSNKMYLSTACSVSVATK